MGGNRSLSELRAALTPNGTLVLVGGEGGGRWIGGAMGRSVRALVLSPFVSHNLRMVVASAKAADLQYLTELLEAAKVTPVLDKTYPLSQVPDAIRYLSAGHARGKVVITV
jgi:NADPH:quinone reductase-like Zn-dependent oxidoreductase